jgi:hypothetical protein
VYTFFWHPLYIYTYTCRNKKESEKERKDRQTRRKEIIFGSPEDT